MTRVPTGEPEGDVRPEQVRAGSIDSGHLLLVGAGPGLGLAVARRFAAGGYRVTLVARSADRLGELARSLDDIGAEINTVEADASSPEDLRARMTELYSDEGAPGVVIYNAVQGVPDQLLSSTVTHLQEAYAVDVIGAIVVAQEAVPAMKAAGFGTMIVTGGGFADHPIPALATVSLGKAALRSAATMLGVDLGPAGIRVATLTIAGQIVAGTAFDPARIAERYWQIVQMDDPWQAEFRFTGESDATFRRGLPMTSFNLERSARELTESIAKGPPLSSVSLAGARKAVEAAQSAPIPMPDIDESWVTVSSAFGDFDVRIVRPPGSTGLLPAILYLHGGGWIVGSWITHDLLTRRLAVGANAAVVFVEYSRAPEAKYPVQIEQCYAAAQWITEQRAGGGFDITRIAVAGDSAGANMSTVLALMAKQRGNVQFVHQSMYYPMTDANAEDSGSLRRFKDGPYGSADGLAWFWNSYLTAEQSRSDILVSPLQAALADLEGLPPALVIVDENDLLRDQGEAYADKLRDAGVPTTSVRLNGTIHDFMRLNALRDSESTRAAISLAIAALRRAFGTE